MDILNNFLNPCCSCGNRGDLIDLIGNTIKNNINYNSLCKIKCINPDCGFSTHSSFSLSQLPIIIALWNNGCVDFERDDKRRFISIKNSKLNKSLTYRSEMVEKELKKNGVIFNGGHPNYSVEK